MISEKKSIQISKFLSLVLRHKPESIGISLDKNGWTSVNVLIQKANAAGVKLDLDLIRHIVNTNNKKRFTFNETSDKIRASQGHSINVDLGYQSQKPPANLYHGTGSQSVESILKTGLEKRNRHQVHLSKDLETAIAVGKRHGKPAVFTVMSAEMYHDNFKFYLSDNGVWLTDHVPAAYLVLAED